jgi:hypothetical protein
MCGWVYVWVGVCVDGCMCRWVYVWMGVFVDGCMCGCVYVWMGVCVEGCTCFFNLNLLSACSITLVCNTTRLFYICISVVIITIVHMFVTIQFINFQSLLSL